MQALQRGTTRATPALFFRPPPGLRTRQPGVSSRCHESRAVRDASLAAAAERVAPPLTALGASTGTGSSRREGGTRGRGQWVTHSTAAAVKAAVVPFIFVTDGWVCSAQPSRSVPSPWQPRRPPRCQRHRAGVPALGRERGRSGGVTAPVGERTTWGVWALPSLPPTPPPSPPPLRDGMDSFATASTRSACWRRCGGGGVCSEWPAREGMGEPAEHAAGGGGRSTGALPARPRRHGRRLGAGGRVVVRPPLR